MHLFRARIQIEPENAKEDLLAAFIKAKASRVDASRILGCDQETFVRWAAMLGIKGDLEVVEKRAKEEGWHHGKNRLGGRPRKKRKARKGS